MKGTETALVRPVGGLTAAKAAVDRAKPAMKKAERTRKRLLDAALNIISRKGYSSATVDEIVQEAGVSKGVAYYHFDSKAAMATAILDRQLEVLAGEFEAVAGQAETAGQALRGMLELFAESLYDQREFAGFLMTELWREGRVWSDDLRDKTQALVDVIAEQFSRGQREGAVRSDIDPMFEAVGIIGLVLTETMYYVGVEGRPLMERTDFIERIYDFAHRSAAVSDLLQ